LNTERPAARILWEQAVQPFQLGGFDLVHELAFVAPLLTRRPFVVTVHDLTFIRYPERLSAARRLYLRLFTGVSCRRARRVQVNSRSTANDLVSLLNIPREKIDLAIPGVEPRFQPLPQDAIDAFCKAHGLPERFLLFVGTIEPRKNLATLLHAYARLPEADRAACPLILAGGMGWMSAELPALIRALGLESDVRLPGYLPASDLVLWYNAARAFVYPSVFEGWGLPVTEALACGSPVLPSNVSSLPEAAGAAGITLDPLDVPAWSEALRRCIHDDAWCAAQQAIALEQAGRFQWKDTAQAAIKSYEKAMQTLR